MKKDIDQILYERGITCGHFWPISGKVIPRELTKEEGLMYLKVWGELNIPKYNLHYPMMAKLSITSGVENVYLTGMIRELYKRIVKSDEDPVTVVAEYNHEMDEVLALSDNDHIITHHFAGYLERSSYDLLQYLKDKEREVNPI